MTKVVVVNQHTNNYGDDAAGSALARAVLRRLRPETLDIFYIWHRSAARLPVDDPAVRHHHLALLAGLREVRPRLALAIAARWLFRIPLRGDLARMVARCRDADATFVSPAGSNIGIYKDWMYLLTLVALVVEGVRPVFCQNTIGESNSRIFNRVARYVLGRSELFVREAKSQEWLADQGLSSYLGVDTALLLETRGDRESARHPYVALVPTRLAHWHRDFKSFDDESFLFDRLPDELASVALRHGVEVVVVPHLHGSEAEASALDRIVTELAARGCVASKAELASFEDYRGVLGDAVAVVSMRYHGLVLAATEGVPCVALAYENKMVEAARYLGLSGFVIPLHELNAGTGSNAGLGALLADAITEREAIAADVRDRLPSLRQIAMGPLLSAESRLLREPCRGPSRPVQPPAAPQADDPEDDDHDVVAMDAMTLTDSEELRSGEPRVADHAEEGEHRQCEREQDGTDSA